MTATRIAIIGAGPAGAAAAVQLARQGMNPVCIERDRPGGLLRHASLVENYPGFPEGIRGRDLADLIEKQLSRHGVRPLAETVRSLSRDGDRFLLHTDGQNLTADYVIVASGTHPNLLDPALVSGQAKYLILRDGAELGSLSSCRIVIIGGGDAAFDYALTAAGAGNRVTIVFRGSASGCLPLLKERAGANSLIECYPEHTVVEIRGENGDGLCECVCETRGNRVSFSADRVLPAIGRSPELSFLSLNPEFSGNDTHLRDRLFFAGDVHNGRFRQAAIAAGEGVKAAMVIFEKIRMGERI